MGNYDREQETATLTADWQSNPRWRDVKRTYSAADVVRLRGSIKHGNTIARLGAEKLWRLLQDGARPAFRPEKDYLTAMGALTGGRSRLAVHPRQRVAAVGGVDEAGVAERAVHIVVLVDAHIERDQARIVAGSRGGGGSRRSA